MTRAREEMMNDGPRTRSVIRPIRYPNAPATSPATGARMIVDISNRAKAMPAKYPPTAKNTLWPSEM